MKNLLSVFLDRSPSCTCSIAVLLASSGLACADAAPRELGFTLTEQDLSAEPSEPFRSPPGEFVGTWVGTASDALAIAAPGDDPIYSFPSGSTRIRVELATTTAPSGPPLTGKLIFGEGTPPPPPTDPEIGYPVGLNYEELLGYDPSLGLILNLDNALPPFEGFEYDVSAGGLIVGDLDGGRRVADGVIRMGFSTNAPLGAWCQLQTPHPHVGLGQSCVESTGGQYAVNPDGTGASCRVWGPPEAHCPPDTQDFSECVDIGEPVAEVNCDKLFLCNTGYCECNEVSCDARETLEALTLRRVGDELVGAFQNVTFSNARGFKVPLGEVRLHAE